jgi:excisionase family DNA binding protein
MGTTTGIVALAAKICQDTFTITVEISGKDAAVRNSKTLLSTMLTDKDDILLNSREVAFLLDLSPDTVNEFARRNILPAFKKGRQWRFRKRDIASFKRHMRGVNAAA